MEDHTLALEAVCKHFKVEYGDAATDRLRKNNRVLGRENARLRRKVAEVDKELRRLQGLLEILHLFAIKLRLLFPHL